MTESTENKTDVREPSGLSKHAEEAFWEKEEKYRWVLNNMADLVAIMDMNLNFIYVSPAIMRMRGFTPEEAVAHRMEQVMTPESLKLCAEAFEEELKLEAEGKANPDTVRILNIEQYRKDGSTVMMETYVSFMRDDSGAPVGVISVSRDITERRQAQEKLQQTLSRLEKAIAATIQVMVSAIEARDPSTAGHQTRVADLAKVIALEMGLVRDKIDGIHIAGSIHDIGKLSVPAEILAKPTTLTELQFSFIKEHPRIGYDILKNVESPWPLAQIVYQHHERMNGTGYPRNLKGDEILLEARIMAVADVVEAMASHRPYRPAYDIMEALDEIEKNRGVLYDADVADACLKLFREKGYRLA